REPTHSAGIDIVALQKEHAHEIALADDLTKRAKGKKWYQDQKHDDTACSQLSERAAAEFGQRIHDLAMMHEADDDLLKRIEDEQQHKKNDRLVQCRPDQRQRIKALTKMQGPPDQHELGADQSLRRGKTKRRERDVVGVENDGLQINQRGQEHVEIGRNDGKLGQFA